MKIFWQCETKTDKINKFIPQV